MTLLRTILVAAAVAFAVPASAADLVDRLVSADLAADYLAARDALVLDASVTDSDLAHIADHPDWRVRQQAAVVLGWRTTPDLFTAALQARPITNRAEQLRFVTAPFERSETFPVLLERYLHGGDGPEIRAALFHAMIGMNPAWEEVARGLFALEPDAGLRVQIVGAMRRAADAPTAHDVLRLGLTDASVEVRAEAAVSTGWRVDGAELADALLLTLGDESTQPRAMAARALGWLSVPEAVEPLGALLTDAHPDVRLHALRSIRRIDLPKAKRLSALPALLQDADPRVVKQAKRVLSER